MLSVLKRERLVLLAGVTLMVALSWLYLVDMASDMAAMPMDGMAMDMPGMEMSGMSMTEAWRLVDVLLLFVMWAVMMVGMMLPSALPMILLFLTINQRRQHSQQRVVPTCVFTAGYISVWTLYSVAATALQWFLHEYAMMSSGMAVQGALLSGGILIVAGLFQFTRLKEACLQQCRSPLSFLMREWREGYRGAFVMGLRHGGYCVGCCWSLMLLLFVAGVMNLLAVFIIAAFVLAEKLMSRGKLLSQLSGILLVLAGSALILGAR